MSPDDGSADPASGPVALAGLLPVKIDGVPYRVDATTINVEDDVVAGDVCWAYFCPGEIAGYASELGVTAGPVDIGLAIPEVPGAAGGALIRAIRVPGADPGDLVDARVRFVRAWSPDGWPIVQPLRLGGRRVTLIWGSPLHGPYDPTYAYVLGDVLFMVYVGPAPKDPLRPGARVAAVLDALR